MFNNLGHAYLERITKASPGFTTVTQKILDAKIEKAFSANNSTFHFKYPHL